MPWNELYPIDREPSMADVTQYVASPLWDAFTAFVAETWNAAPRIEHSRCGGAPGWNVKYKARGRALCTVYPRDGFFTCMVSVGSKEKPEAEALLSACDPYVRELYERSAEGSFGRWLMIDVTSEDILRDAEALMMLRAKPKEVR
ncbi:DUF3788 domain-containing protein [Gordonibacter massiliensis (ex Traore et al. 2017)]|uniref:DUF3788 domain-containing protein n=1 Tax=Gordonibacter massiliensis (ex Traore et al. 2017) TaxID=1841863 RepID=UPI001C8B7C1D|nr:DUF3788 domain-containing protein [Gordonibacter massiliensis (ex Traore et al. 2017)]MBX9033545.1 DUF3788 domain-containing protein [Gordonibacter massiliensis (ex Traore et al. 2017)]